MAFWGRVVEHTSTILESTMLCTYRRKTGSRSALYTSIQPHRAPGQGSSLLIPFMAMAGTSPMRSEIGRVFCPL